MSPDVRRIHDVHSDADQVAFAASILREGGLVVYPTETLYGIGADALNPRAVDRVRRIKGRNDGKPILLLADSRDMVMSIVRSVSTLAETAMERCWPGPLTLVLPAAASLGPGVTAGTGTVGVRVPEHVLCRALVRAVGRPITSTSANLSGEPTPSSIEDLVALFGGQVDLYLDGGIVPSGQGSTVLDLAGRIPRIVRQGAFPLEELRRLIPELGV